MRVVVQRVVSARVEVGGETVGAIGAGLLVLAGFEEGDGDADLAWLSAKLCRLRIFADAAGVMNRSVVDSGGEILAVSQFTLFASVNNVFVGQYGTRALTGNAAGKYTGQIGFNTDQALHVACKLVWVVLLGSGLTGGW